MLVHKLCLSETLDKRQANHLFWSPNGQFIVLAGLRSMSGVLDFVDTGGDEVTVMQSAEHFMATDVEWDPTGRYIATGKGRWNSWWGNHFTMETSSVHAPPAPYISQSFCPKIHM